MGRSELPPSAKGTGDVLSHLCESCLLLSYSNKTCQLK